MIGKYHTTELAAYQPHFLMSYYLLSAFPLVGRLVLNFLSSYFFGEEGFCYVIQARLTLNL